jgi:hypothetical protein
LLSAVSAICRNRIVLNNIDKLQIIIGGINGMLTVLSMLMELILLLPGATEAAWWKQVPHSELSQCLELAGMEGSLGWTTNSSSSSVMAIVE